MQTGGDLPSIFAQWVAAMLSFGCVFIHPFIDGNGRIHRLLIHAVLARRAVIPKDIIVPLSAYMLRHPGEYAAALGPSAYLFSTS